MPDVAQYDAPFGGGPRARFRWRRVTAHVEGCGRGADGVGVVPMAWSDCGRGAHGVELLLSDAPYVEGRGSGADGV